MMVGVEWRGDVRAPYPQRTSNILSFLFRIFLYHDIINKTVFNIRGVAKHISIHGAVHQQLSGHLIAICASSRVMDAAGGQSLAQCIFSAFHHAACIMLGVKLPIAL